MNTKHTPGPWRHSPGANDHGLIKSGIITDTTRSVASVHHQENPEVYEANILLVVSAPDFLRAAINVSEEAENGLHTIDSVGIQMLRAAIQKARGES